MRMWCEHKRLLRAELGRFDDPRLGRDTPPKPAGGKDRGEDIASVRRAKVLAGIRGLQGGGSPGDLRASREGAGRNKGSSPRPCHRAPLPDGPGHGATAIGARVAAGTELVAP